MGIEPTLEAWEAAVLPLNYTRLGCRAPAQHLGRGAIIARVDALPAGRLAGAGNPA